MNIKNFLDKSLTKFQVIDNLKSYFLNNGFRQLFENQDFNLEKGKSYFLSRSKSSMIAFSVPQNDIGGFNILSSHIDSPCLKLKVETETVDLGHAMVRTEVYGGLIHQSVMNEILSCAGVVYYKKFDSIYSKSIVLDSKFYIPNLAIHLNRNINEGIKYNEQEHLRAIILDGGNKKNIILNDIANKLDIQISDILQTELFLTTSKESDIINDYIISPRIDNLSSVFASMVALNQKNLSDKISLCAFFDYEEIGSVSPEGADSLFLTSILDRILVDLDFAKKDTYKIFANSKMLSLDASHASHPNYKGSFDLDYKNIINNGFTVKISPSLNYSQDNQVLAEFYDLIKKQDIKYQIIKNPSNIRGGKTLGVIASALINIPSIDLGIPMHSMHHLSEMCGLYDIKELIKASKLFFSYL